MSSKFSKMGTDVTSRRSGRVRLNPQTLSRQTIFFYDLTSTYFEGQALNNPSAKRGYSRDKRPDCKQVVVGLVINRDGFPQAHEISDGNTQDRASLPAMLDALEARVGA